jgi:hypothetical protein
MLCFRLIPLVASTKKGRTLIAVHFKEIGIGYYTAQRFADSAAKCKSLREIWETTIARD